MNRSKYMPSSWFDPRITVRASATHGQGIFATDMIRAGEVVVIWGGDVYTEEELPSLKLEGAWSYSIIDEGVYLFAPADAQDYFINHACDPNIWMADEVTLIARRDIQPNEELRGDYALWEMEPDYRLEPCTCGSALCRTRITGNDWMQPELQTRYENHFLPFLNRRISAKEGKS